MGHWLHGMARRAEQIELNRSSCAEASARVLEALRVHGAKTKLALVGGDRRFESLPLHRRVHFRQEPEGRTGVCCSTMTFSMRSRTTLARSAGERSRSAADGLRDRAFFRVF